MRALSRTIAALALASCGIVAIAGAARAADDDYPNHPVRWLVGYPPGGSTDICARLIGQYLSEHLHQQFAVENKPGAGNNLATEIAVHAPADGLPCFWSIPPMPLMPACTKTCRSISSATWRRWPDSCGRRT
jgi:tripartite-type tricarboxylate transporter receptor subunit TctC